MKKLFLFAVTVLLGSLTCYACEKNGPKNHFHSLAFGPGQLFPEFYPRTYGVLEINIRPQAEIYSVRGGDFDPQLFIGSKVYFQPFFGSVYEEFSMIRYEFPEANVFCRMESETCNRYGVMFSIHAGNAR